MAKHGDDRSGNLVCSFCGKSQKEVRKLIAGPTVYICDECVDICIPIVNRGTEDERSAPATAAATGLAVTCRLCQLATLPAGSLFLPGRGTLCSACATAV